MSYSIPGAGGVSSVNGKAGAVVLVPGDLGAAPLASPALTGNPTAPTPATGDASTLIATTALVNAKIAAQAPGLAPVQSVAGRTGAVTLSGADVATTAGANSLTGATLAAAVRQLDGLVMPRVAGYLTNTPPSSPADGDCYIIGAAPSGAWAGQAGKVTRYSSAVAWEFFTPKNGWTLQANSARESYRYTGGAWEIFYQEGTWTPVLNGFTVTGIPVLSGRFTRNGRLGTIWVKIDPNGGTVGSTVVNSFMTGLPLEPSVNSPCMVVDTTAIGFTGIGEATSPAVRLYTPTWSAQSSVMVIQGNIEL